MELTINVPPEADRVALFGTAERNLKLLREALGVTISARGDTVRLSGEGQAVNQAAAVLAELTQAAQKREPMSRTEVVERIREKRGETALDDTDRAGGNGQETDLGELEAFARGERIQAQTQGQRAYVKAIQEKDLVFCTGPAGTGKTYLAVAAAVSMLKRREIRKLVLVRPAVEAGEKIGFLPGDMQQKVNPYIRPLLDALHDMVPVEQIQRLMDSDLVEIVPLAFMRGRTLNDAVIILDEAQNTTPGQMLMFLTRLGHGSKMVVTGDTSQVDLEEGALSGLVDAAHRLRNVPGTAVVDLGNEDIVRHSLVERIIEAYGRGEDRTRETGRADPSRAG